ncbi:MAG: hypothetical protein AAFR38_11350 [Planctomycetota bacterium]
MLNPRWRGIGLAAVLLAAIAFAAGVALEIAGVRAVPDVPIRETVWTAARFVAIAGLLAIVFARERTEDEFIDRLRLESFRATLLVVALAIAANEVVYFFADRRTLDGAGVVLLQLSLYAVVFHAQRVRAGLQA